MIPIVTTEQMQAIDAAAPEPVETLIDRAARAVAWVAREMLGGTYGRRVTVVAGTGNNGADGRRAAAHLARRGVRCDVLDAFAPLPSRPWVPDLVIDAAVGTGISRAYEAPDFGAPVLAVDIPSGIDGDTGAECGTAVRADRTVTFAALKPGLLLPPGRWHTGPIGVADIGLAGHADAWHVLAEDVARWVPSRPAEAHKWNHAVLVVAGSPEMTGAARLAVSAAQRAGAGMVLAVLPDVDPAVEISLEAVRVATGEGAWHELALARCQRVHALVVGPGMGTSMAIQHQIRTLLAACARPAVIDGDGLTALGSSPENVLADRPAATVLTPHDGEFERLTGARPGPDRLDAARRLARATGAVVLLKGPTTAIAAPDGRVRTVASGDERLATAGSGDVLSGILGAFLAGGADPFDAAAAGAFVHGVAAQHTGRTLGLIASDLVAAVPDAIAAVRAGTVDEPIREIGSFR